MSNALAIAAVTETIRSLLATGLQFVNEDSVSTKPPDKARDPNDNSDQINLFLYHVLPNAAWRNMDLPKQTRPGETSPPALALDLDYLITAYGSNDHKLLGESMLVMHDTPLLSPDVIASAFPNSGVELQFERVRITLQPLSLEDMYRLWNGFQTQYRVSAAYRVSVVLIESQRSSKAPLPVLKRGKDDQGVHSVASASSSLSALVFPLGQSSAMLGDSLTIQGQNLSPANTTVRFTHAADPLVQELKAHPVVLTPSAGNKAGELTVVLPNDAAAMSVWVPGFYTLSLVIQRPGLPAWTTNELPLGIAPRITRDLAHLAAPGTLTLTSSPRTGANQRVYLIFGDKQIPATTITNPADLTKPTEIAFDVPAMDNGKYVVRLRVDGVDSFPVIQTGTPPKPDFDPNQIVEIP